MVPSGHPASIGGPRSSSGISLPPQSPFSSLVSPRTQFSPNPNAMNILGSMPNVSSLLNHTFGGVNSRPNASNSELGSSAESESLAFQNPTPNQSILENIQSHPQQLRGMGAVKLEPQTGSSDPNSSVHQFQTLRGLGTVKSESPVKIEGNPQSDPSIFLQQQQQQQQMINLQRQNSHPAAQMNLLQHQHRIMQMKQQQQQQQILKSLPQQRVQQQQQQQQQQQIQQQALALRPQMKPSAYEPGMCARRLTLYMYHQKHRPSDNNIEFWRKFVAEYFAPHARKRWCVSLYGSGRQTTGVFPQDVWYCEICNRKPGRGFETTVEVLPRLYKIKYDSGTQEELLYVDMPREYQNASGQIVLDYAKAIQESVFDQLRVVRDGQLRIVFSSDLKICSWEFCARRHEELIPRRLIIPQVSQLGQVAQKYQAATQNGASNLSTQEVQNSCNLFVASTRQLAKALEVPLVNDLGYTKRYVRCLQIAEVVNCMKDLIDYSRETKTGPMESLINFPRRTTASTGEGQPPTPSLPSNPHVDDPTSARLAASSSALVSVNNHLNPSTDASPAAGPYSSAQIPSTSSSNSVPLSQQNPVASNSGAYPAAQFGDTDPGSAQSSVQQILQEMMMSSHLGGEMKMANGVVPGLSSMLGNSMAGGGAGYGTLAGGGGSFGSSLAAGGIRAMMGNNSLSFNGRNGLDQQQELGSRLLSGGLGAAGNFNNHQFGWKTSP